MKPAFHFIWSPLVYSITGFLMAYAISRLPSTGGDFQRFALLAMPTGGLIIGWFVAYLATPIKMRPDKRLITDALSQANTGVHPAVTPVE